MNFSSFASDLLQSKQQQPLFYSTASSQSPSARSTSGPSRGSGANRTLVEQDILGRSYDDEGFEDDRLGPGDADGLSSHNPAEQRRTALGLSNVVSAAFASRLGSGLRQGVTPTPRGFGWKLHESATHQAPRAQRYTLTDSDLSEEEEDEAEGPLPGTFVSVPSPPSVSVPVPDTMTEPLIGRKTLYIYPGSHTISSSSQATLPSRVLYRDSIWIVIYGLALALTGFIAVQAYLATPTIPPTRTSDYPSLLASTPVFLMLSFMSLLTSGIALSLLLVLRHTLRPLLSISMLIGPLLFALIGIIAFGASFGARGVESDQGWKTGMIIFAIGCITMSWLLGRASVSRSKQLNRAVLIGELACQTIIHHPPLILLSLVISFASTLASVPFLALITSLLSLSSTHSTFAAYGSSFVFVTYVWTLALLRGIGKATTSGVVGSWYFEGQERQESEIEPGLFPDTVENETVQLTRAAFARAKGPSLGSIIGTSLLTTLLQTFSTLLRSMSRILRRYSQSSHLSIAACLIPICDFLSGWATWYNGYTMIYIGLTGKTAAESAREVASVLFSNRASNIRDATLLRLILTLTLAPLTLLPSLVSFLILSTSYLSPYSGGYVPMFALLSVVVPAWTSRVILGLVVDAVDTLFIATHLDAENEEKSCPKAVQAFEEPE